MSNENVLLKETTNESPYEKKPWLKKYPEKTRSTIKYPELPLTHFMEESVKNFPDNVATVFFGAKISYRKLDAQVKKFATFLAERGIQKGDRVGIMLPNCPQGVIAYYGALSIGAVVVQFNPLYVEREIEFQLNDSECKAMVVMDALFPRVEKVKLSTKLKTVIVTGLQDYMGFPTNILFPFKLKKEGRYVKVKPTSGVYLWKDVIRTTAANPPKVKIAPNDMCLIQYTGGTTGVPKGVMLTHRNLVVNTLQVLEWMQGGDKGKEKVLCVLPFFHVYGMTVAMNMGISLGGALIIQPKFEVKAALKAIDKYKPTLFPGAPTMYVGVNTYPEISKYDVSSIKFCLSGSAPLPMEVAETFERITGGILVEGFGLSESSPCTHCNPIPRELRKMGTIGLPMTDTEAKIVDSETGAEMPVGEIGELAIKGPQVMLGYWNRPDATAEVLKDGWLYTGDIARMDEEGYFSIVDRKKDLIIAGGFNIYPREVEEVLFQHPAIQEVAVAGVPDEYRGETVKAFIVLKEGQQATAEEIIRFSKGKLATFKVPRQIEFRDELPKTIIGKVLKRELRKDEGKK